MVKGFHMRKIALIGGTPDRLNAPWGDKTWEIWALHPWALVPGKMIPVAPDAWFEMHAYRDMISRKLPTLPSPLVEKKGGRLHVSDYWRKVLPEVEQPIYMQRHFDAKINIPTSVRYPIEAVVDEFGKIFTCTIAYMIALAILKKPDVIGLWGMVGDFRKAEYQIQKPTVEWLLGQIGIRGMELIITTDIPEACRLEPKPNGEPSYPPVLYAYDWTSKDAWWRYENWDSQYWTKPKGGVVEA